ncbi:acyl-CoA dehydrogenase family protein [Mycobacterium sp. pW045]|uniref:acyl-CoA dehydrogenase family protein n=1 Tax=Mycobacterium sp. pW045 TaxID=3238984 RepID=UPI00351BE9C3
MDFRDSPAEADFRNRLRSWLAERAGTFPAAGDDEYWARQGEWHQALYGAGFFGVSWPRAYGGQELPPVYDVIVDEELAAAGAPPRPSLGYLVVGLGRHASKELQQRFLPGMIDGTQRWCQGFSEPGAGSDLASLTTTATRDGDDYVIHGHKIWTSYSDVADWCLLLARTDKDAPRHRGISAFIISMHQPGIEQRPLRMINGVTTEFGQVLFDGATVPASQLVGEPGEGWKLAMTVVGHEREPSTLGYSARYGKLVRQMATRVDRAGAEVPEELAWAAVETEMLRLHVRRRLSEQLDGLSHGPEGSLDKLLMTWVEQSVGHAALAVGGVDDPDLLSAYLYSRAQSVMGGTSQIQKNIIAGRILGLTE